MNRPKGDGTWLTIREAAKYARVSQRTVRNWLDKTMIRRGRTPSGHLRLHIDDLVVEQRHPAQPGCPS